MKRLTLTLCLGLATAANAQFSFTFPGIRCMGLTVSQCQQPGALTTGLCASQCTAILRAEYLKQAWTAPQKVVSVSENLTGANTPTYAGWAPEGASSHFMSGGTATAAHVIERHRTNALASSGSTFMVDPHLAWRGNGARVGSCDELVFDFFRSFSEFEDNTRGAASVDVFRAAYASGGIAFQNLRTADGVDVGPMPPTGPQPKNAYFSALDLRMPNGGTSANEGWASFVAPYSASITWNWNTHQIYGNWFISFFTPESLDSLAAEQEAYLSRLAARRERYDRYETELATCVADHGAATHPDCVTLTSQASTDLSTMDFAIGVELTNAQARGALSTSLVNRWDWSPRFFERWLQQSMSRVREPMRTKCMRVSSGSFTTGVVKQVLPDGAGIPNSSGPGLAVVPADWLRTPFEANFMLTAIENWAKTFDVPRDPATGKATLSQWHGDSARLGNDRFGVEYSWTMGWGLTNIETRFCQAQLVAKGFFDSKATVLGRAQPLLMADAHAWSESVEGAPGDTNLLTHRRVEVLGTPIYAPLDTTTPLTFHLSTGESRDQKVTLAVVVVPVFGVPVKVAGGVSGTEGFDVEVTGGLTRTCAQSPASDTLEVGANGTVTPFISVNGFATASVDAYVIEVGIKGEVTLVKASLPLTLRVQTVMDQQAQVSLEAETNLKLSLTALDGRVAIFGRILGKSSERELISWRGPQIADATLFELKYVPALRLDLLQLATRY